MQSTISASFSNDYRDPEVVDENDPVFIQSQLRPDHEFSGERARTRFPFDDDQCSAFICHVQGGSSYRVESEDVRDAFTGMGPKDKRRDWVVIDVLGELGMEALELSLMQSGASPREIARLYRKHPQEITWTVVWVLNQWSDHGQRELPFALDKLAAVDGDLYDEYFF